MNRIPLILIPGLLCDHALWDHQVAVLGDMADCVVTAEHLRHETIGRIAEAVVSDVPERFALAGLSMGGYIALEICRRYPDRVARLALLDTSAQAETPEQTQRRERLMALSDGGRFAEVADLLYAALVHPDRKNDLSLKRRIVDMAHRIGPAVFIRQQHAIIGRSNQVPHLAAISCPTVVVCGAQDQVTPLACAEEMASGIDGAHLEIIGHCGHMSTMEAPERVSGILQAWLKSA
jgi:pimeloyl-ACP methyl ester carboxylesterase